MSTQLTEEGTPTGTRGLTVQERAARDRAMAAAHLKGEPWRKIAERFGVSKATARRAARACAPALAEDRVEAITVEDAEALLALLIRAQEEALRRALALVREAQSPTVALTAVNAVRGLLSPITENLIRLGYVEDGRDEVLRRRVEVAQREMVRIVLAAAEESGVSAEALDRALGFAPEERAMAVGRMAA